MKPFTFFPGPGRIVRVGAVLMTGALLVTSTPSVGAPDLAQRQAIAAVIQELDYLIDHSERLATKYAHDTGSIRFNYPAFLDQLRITRERARAYLNETHTAVLASPPPTAADSLTLRR